VSLVFLIDNINEKNIVGQLERAENYKSRFNHLNSSFHNYLRVTRILKSLGELGFEHYKLPFIKFMLIEIFDTQLLVNCKGILGPIKLGVCLIVPCRELRTILGTIASQWQRACWSRWVFIIPLLALLKTFFDANYPESIIKQYLGVNDLSDEEQDIDDDIADKWLGGDSDDDEEQQNEDDKDEESANKSNEHDEEQDIDDDIADKWLGGDSDDDDEQDEDREIQQALEDLISADDDDELVAPGEVIGVKESVEIRIANDAEQSVETKNESQTSILEL